jgi:hypothetical protein
LKLSDLGAPIVAPSLSQQQAYDLLPPAIRQAISEAAYGVNARVLLMRHLRGHSEAELLAHIREWARASEREAVARGMPRELAGWPPIVPRPRKRARRAARTW